MRPLHQLLNENEFHRLFVVAGIALAVSGGFSLAIALSVDAASGFSLGPRWIALAQTHGHLQTVGFLGLIIIGVALRVAPRFAGVHLRHPRLVPLILITIVLGVLLRALGQSLADHEPLGAVMAAGAWLEAIGAITFVWLLLSSMHQALRDGNAPVLFFASGAVWFAIQAILGAVWITELAIDHGSVLPTSKNAVLLLLQIFGFHLAFLLGVGARALPTFFDRVVPPRHQALTAWVIIQLGLFLTATALAWWATQDDRLWQTENAGLLVLAVGLIGGAAMTRAWGRPSRLRPATQSIGRLPQLAVGWLIIAAFLMLYFAINGFAEGRPLAQAEFDSLRHLVALGVLVMALAGMAHIVLPEFAVERLAGRSGARRAWLFGGGLSIIAATRAYPGVANAGLPNTSDYWHMAAAAILGLILVAWLGWLFLRAMREQPILLEEVSDRVTNLRAHATDPSQPPSAASR
jgi:uncharacterized protein involved in response to NO